MVVGRSPVRMLVRDGLHSGLWQWALVNVVPRAASRSMFGVFTCGWPPSGPTQSLRSSMAMKRTLGFSAACRRRGEQQKSREGENETHGDPPVNCAARLKGYFQSLPREGLYSSAQGRRFGAPWEN